MKGNMTTPRINHAASILSNGEVLVTGAGGTYDSHLHMCSIELYDPSTGL